MTGARRRRFDRAMPPLLPTILAADRRARRFLPLALALWLGLAGLLALSAGALVWASPLFAWERDVDEMPALALAVGLIVAGLCWLLCLPLIAWTVRAGLAADRRLLIVMIVGGLGLRLAMLATTPALEDDWHRYLWDGAVTAAGLNPYAHVPELAPTYPEDHPLNQLSIAAGDVWSRINHNHLRTIYPPIAAGAFALASLIQPFSLAAWRLVCLGGEALTLTLILALLARTGRPALLAALYWWCPLVIKETMNSAHMEAIVTPLVLATLLLTLSRRPLAATGVLGLAIGTKIWPLILAPLVLRPLVAAPVRLAGALALLAGLAALMALPILAAGLDETSGFVAYATHWQANSLLVPWLAPLLAPLLPEGGLEPARVTRVLLAGVVGLTALAVAVRPAGGPRDTVGRFGVVIGALLLASPAQFPWYGLWLLPLLPLLGWSWVALLAVLLPLYYTAFHLEAAGVPDVFAGPVLLAQWLPVYGLAANTVIGSIVRARRRSRGRRRACAAV